MTERINGPALWKLRRPHIRPKFLAYCSDPVWTPRDLCSGRIVAELMGIA